MKYPVANNYIETLERVTKQLHEMAFSERHPEPLTYEEIQAMASEVNMLDIMRLYSEAVSSDSLRLFKGMFSDILSNPHVVNGTARKRITIFPYYPASVTLINDNGNKIALSKEKRELVVPGTDEEGKKVERSIISYILVGTETDAEGKELAKHEVISYLFDGDKITKRLLDEGRDAQYILFFLSQTNQLQEAIFERWEDVRVMFDYIEKPNLKKYQKDFNIALLEKEGKEKPEAWKAKNIITDKVSSENIEVAAVNYKDSSNRFIVDYRSIKQHGKEYDLFSFLNGGYSTKGVGCFRAGADFQILKKALEGGVLYELSNGNRLDILCYAFMAFADNYIHVNDRKKYKDSIRLQAERFGYTYKDNLTKEISTAIDKLIKP